MDTFEPQPGGENVEELRGAPQLPTLAHSAAGRTGVLVALLLAEAGAFALLMGSGNIPEIVSTLFRALLTL